MPILDARWRSENGWALAVVLSGLAITGAIAFLMVRAIDSQANERFAQSANRVADEIERRLKQSGLGLSGVRAFFVSAGQVNRKQFQNYVAAQNLAADFPGVRGFGLIQRVERKDLDRMVQAERADNAPGFAIRQLDDKDRDDLLVIRYIEPTAWNKGAQGLDIGSERARRTAAEHAIASGEPTMTENIVLVQDNQRTAGALLFAPLYRPGMPVANPQQRRAALIGLLFSPIVVSELMQGIAAAEVGAIEFQLFDPKTPTQPNNDPFYASNSSNVSVASSGAARFEHTQVLSLAQREIRLRIIGTPQFEAAVDYTPSWVLLTGGSIVSLLLGLLLRQQASGRRRAEELAQEMTRDLDRLAAVVRHTSNAVCISGSDQRINWINEGFTRISGYTMQDALGKTPGELLGSSKADPSVLQTLFDSAAAGAGCRVEILNRAKDGREYWIDTEVQPLRDTQGELTGFMQIGTDITANKAVEAALRENERLLRLVTANMGGRLAYFDREHRLRFANQATYDFFGGTAQSRIGCSFEDMLGPRQTAKIGDAVDRVLTGEPQTYESESVLADGQTISAIVHLVPDLQGSTVQGFVALAVDVTLAKREAQELARQADTLLRTALEAAGLGLVLFDSQERLVFCNENYRSLFEGELGMLVKGTRFGDILQASADRGLVPEAIGGGDADWVAERLARFREASGEHLRQMRDGRSVRMIERKTPDGHYVGLHLDISDLVRATEAAQESARAKGQFLANMSHEIRTPMNAILGLLALLRKTQLSTHQADYAAKTENAARTMLGLLNDILDYSKVESGKMTLERRPFELDDLLQDLGVMLSTGVDDKQLEILFDIDPTLPPVVIGDKLRLQQVLINLGGNAVKFTEHGEVVLSVRSLTRDDKTATLEFAVRDTGIGIDPRHHASIFNVFSQAEGSITRRFGGTGLGLSISSDLVKLMGGTISLDSSPGNGSRFSFTIALELPAPAIDEILDVPATEPRPQTRHALVVDDNASARELMRLMGESLGWTIAVADRADRALAMLAAQAGTTSAFQVVLMDWQMPGMDGWQACERIRQMAGVADSTLILMVSVHGREQLAQRSQRERDMLNGYLVKPITPVMLARAVAAALLGQHGPAPDSLTAAPGAPEQRLAALRILLAEDNQVLQEVMRELLNAEGAIVDIAHHGQAALDLLAASAKSFDVILMDLQMPVMDGLTATRKIRSELGLKSIPIIAMTANALASDRQACLEAGMNDHIGKPFELDHLVALLRLHCGLGDGASAAQAAASRNWPVAADLAATEAGIALQAAIQRMGGRSDVYLRMLRLFREELDRAPQELHSKHSAGADSEALAMQLHTLRGQSASLGLSRLSAGLSEVEMLLRQQPRQVDDAVAVERAVSYLLAARPGVQALLEAMLGQPTTPAETATPALSVPHLQDALRVLAEQLRESDMAATDTIQTLCQRYGAHPVGRELRAAQDTIDRLDFSQALLQCNALIKAHAS